MSERDRLEAVAYSAAIRWGKIHGKDVKNIMGTISTMVGTTYEGTTSSDEYLAWHLEKLWDKGPSVIVFSSNRQPNGWYEYEPPGARLDRILECDVEATVTSVLGFFYYGVTGHEWETLLQSLGYRFRQFNETPGDYAG
jgi:hypothetical protein